MLTNSYKYTNPKRPYANLKSCPLNSNSTLTNGTQCLCNTRYKLSSDKKSCIKSSVDQIITTLKSYPPNYQINSDETKCDPM